MATFVNDCPHCGASSAAFNIPYASENPVRGMYWNALAICPACGYGIYVCARWHGTDFARLSGDVGDIRDVDILNVSPRRVRTNAPEYVPVAAKRAFDEGAECLATGKPTAAAAMFRRCLEIALKAHSPDIEAWKLEKRIDKLAAERKITDDMKTWAHRVRLDGNDALHEEEEFTKESATELMEFTSLLLIYLYTLPEKIRLRLEAESQ